MGMNHKATPEQWALLRRQSEILGASDATAILEIRARVEALEAAANPSAAPAVSLVDRVINAIAFEHEKTPEPRYEARAAIREVAAWLREQDPEPGPVGKWLGQISTPCGVMADMIEQEADR